VNPPLAAFFAFERFVFEVNLVEAIRVFFVDVFVAAFVVDFIVFLCVVLAFFYFRKKIAVTKKSKSKNEINEKNITSHHH
jgi:hypothetical protein